MAEERVCKCEANFLVIIKIFEHVMMNVGGILKYLFSFLTGCLFFISTAYPQIGGQEIKIQAAFDQYRSRFIVEKLFVHTDKDTYISREICWFRIYYTDAF